MMRSKLKLIQFSDKIKNLMEIKNILTGGF